MALVPRTKREAQIECARLVTELNLECYVEPSKTTLAAFLDQRLAHVEPAFAPRTFERYAEIARKSVVPLLGQIVLTKLRPEPIAAAYAAALKSGRRDGAGGLKPRTVHHMHRILKQAMATAVRWRMLQRNPLDDVDPLKVERGKMRRSIRLRRRVCSPISGARACSCRFCSRPCAA